LRKQKEIDRLTTAYSFNNRDKGGRKRALDAVFLQELETQAAKVIPKYTKYLNKVPKRHFPSSIRRSKSNIRSETSYFSPISKLVCISRVG